VKGRQLSIKGVTMKMNLAGVVLDSPDPRKLADFYVRLLGWTIVDYEPDWAKLEPPGGGTGLSFQAEPLHVSPVWPTAKAHPQMQIHLDIGVDDLESAVKHAIETGAVLAGHQPLKSVRILLDPAGHPFCLFKNM
jgi:predicted enzyme related to lactoylglutathione lyase